MEFGIQWKLLIVITNNVINGIMRSFGSFPCSRKWSHLESSSVSGSNSLSIDVLKDIFIFFYSRLPRTSVTRIWKTNFRNRSNFSSETSSSQPVSTCNKNIQKPSFLCFFLINSVNWRNILFSFLGFCIL